MTPIALLLPLLPLLPLTTATPICTPTTPAILPCTTPTIWTLTNITYTSTAIYSTPAHLATAYASFSFSLSSNAVPYTYTCSAGSSSYPTYFNGDQAYTCTASNGDATAQATWTWNAGTKEVYFNANWVCVDGCLAKRYMGAGRGIVPFQCVDDGWQNPDWKLGEIYRREGTKCGPTGLEIRPPVVPFLGGNGPN